MKRLMTALLLAGLSTSMTVAWAGDTAKAATPITGNLSFTSDYLFRGVSLSGNTPAIQGGFDYAPATGFYIGTWGSNVSGITYPGGNMEWDVYGGYNRKINDDLSFSTGLYEYLYPRATTVPGGQRFNTLDYQLAVTWKGLQVKNSYALTDYFGLNNASGGAQLANGAPELNGNSKGTDYIELNYSHDLPMKMSLNLHAGHVSIRHYSDFNYNDYKVGVSREIGGFNCGLAYATTNAPKGASLYVANGRNLADGRFVATVGKTF